MRVEMNFDKAAGQRQVAVIGSGISGLAAAWLLAKNMSVTIYEADARLGGHANTFLVPTATGNQPVDTGFIVYNDRNYPNLVALFDHLDVPTRASDMSFAASLDGGAFEYSGSGIRGLLGQRTNVMRPRFWRMLSDIRRFYREASALLERQDLASVGLGIYLYRNGYGATFVEDHLLPMGAAIWSTTAREIQAYPLHAFIRFFESHGLLTLSDRPKWRTVKGGSREYVNRLIRDFSGSVRLRSAVRSVRRAAGTVEVTDCHGHTDTFTDVVIATHADQALAILADADGQERHLLGAFRYTNNTAVLHSDENLMPRRRKTWASWNYIGEPARAEEHQLCVTYWMNRLQGIDPANPLFVTLNPVRQIAPERTIASFDYTHPLFDLKALSAQKELWRLQGRNGTWFCGAHFGSGFHEDGVQAGLAVAESLGGVRRPWTVADESGRIHVGPALVAAE
ncbi:FAD-dependent oxidoreductase [Sinorhizobium sp. BG8]|uniref:NAD(P)/FAD-dependent oxidoreductase n=1 Tax=Sinorhizobium sp. BG8 TaxID=2613773 RepID=UPI00193DDAC4|nr:FAD-dependent oxidoreductase [Sinorhizobium sp. BG8]QRM57540.1 FAD-dependent oxidoreductase [Sinorhizobium sp. BG8]